MSKLASLFSRGGYRCPACGSKMKDKELFCPGCGQPRNAEPAYAEPEYAPEAYEQPEYAPEAAAPAVLVCAACGNPMEEGDIFCMNCGTRREDAPAAPADTFVPMGFEEAAPFEDEAPVFAPEPEPVAEDKPAIKINVPVFVAEPTIEEKAPKHLRPSFDETPVEPRPNTDATAVFMSADELIFRAPAAAKPVVETPVSEAPVIDIPAVEQSVAEEPVVEEPVIEEPVVEEPVAEEPVVEKPAVEEPVAEEPVVEEPVAEEPIVEEPVAEEPIVEEPIVEEPVIEKPIVEEPVAEEPIVEEPVAEIPVADENADVDAESSESNSLFDDIDESAIWGKVAAEEPVAEAPVYTAPEPAAETPANTAPAYEEPAYAAPVAEAPAYTKLEPVKEAPAPAAAASGASIYSAEPAPAKPAPKPAVPQPTMYGLRFLAEPDRDICILRSGAMIGRLSTCSLVIDEPSVSRRHCHIDFVNGQWAIVILGVNGIVIDGEHYTNEYGRPVPLTDGCIIEFPGISANTAVQFLANPF